MKLKIVTKIGVIFDEDITSLTLPAVHGSINALSHHAFSVVLLKAGKLVYDGCQLEINDGVARIGDNEALILTEVTSQ